MWFHGLRDQGNLVSPLIAGNSQVRERDVKNQAAKGGDEFA
jgi:hypothetical protein